MNDHASAEGQAREPVVIKKYANRRLYNTATSSYVTLDHLSQMVKEGIEFTVSDAKTGEDITRSVLTQIIVEEESKGESMLPIGFLRQLIAFYGDSLQGLLPRYLEHSMSAFVSNQEQMRRTINDAMGMPFVRLEELGRQNVQLFENAMLMFTPFAPARGGPRGASRDQAEAATPGPAAPAAPEANRSAKDLDDLRDQLERLQRKVDDLSSGRA